MFPVLTESEIARIGRFGTVRRYERGFDRHRSGKSGLQLFVMPHAAGGLIGEVQIGQRYLCSGVLLDVTVPLSPSRLRCRRNSLRFLCPSAWSR